MELGDELLWQHTVRYATTLHKDHEILSTKLLRVQQKRAEKYGLVPATPYNPYKVCQGGGGGKDGKI